MENRTKKIIIIAVVVTLAVILLWNISFIRNYKSEPISFIPPKTAEQIEMQELVKKIQSGSILWDQHNQEESRFLIQAEAAAIKRDTVADYTNDYRGILCKKFGYYLSDNGGLVEQKDCSVPFQPEALPAQ